MALYLRFYLKGAVTFFWKSVICKLNKLYLQSALTMKEEYEVKMQQTEEKFEDVSAERITADQTYKQ